MTYPPLSELAEGVVCRSYANALFFGGWRKAKWHRKNKS